MNKEEIEKLKDFTIDLTNIDELTLGWEVCSKKSNMVIQEFADTIIQLQQENKILKENAENNDKVVDKVIWENMLLKKENEQLKDNWNELEEIIKKKFVAQGSFTSYEWNDLLNELLDKMQEMEKNYGNAEDNT